LICLFEVAIYKTVLIEIKMLCQRE